MSLVMLFLFTVIAGLAVAIWEFVGITKHLKESGEPSDGGAMLTALKKKASMSASTRSF